jgi:putative PIN family toxin of toxin-antitoxin system
VTVEHADRPGRPRLVLDPGVYVSAAISGVGAPAQLLGAAIEGRVVLLVSSLLVEELREVLSRPKLRRCLTSADAQVFVEGVELLAESVQDPPADACAGACRDSEDDYLVALAEVHEATLLVSGDKDLLAVDRPGLDVRTPRDALDAVLYEHPWGPALIPSDARSAWEAACAAGDAGVLETTAGFVTALHEQDVLELLPYLVTPESLDAWRVRLADVRSLVAGRGMASGVHYPVDGVAYVKLPPDPGDALRATGDVLLADVVIVTLQQRTELPDLVGLGGWRVHAIGDYVRPEELPPRAGHPSPP